jgi:endonuclease/exonuclease/phosphatase family metal-dependent hydrolase
MKFRIATLNVWALPGPFSDQVNRRMRAIGAHLADLELDAIAFQEVWTAGARRRLVASGRQAGFSHAWYRDVQLGGGGLLVLSRHPFEQERFEPFDLRGYAERIDQAEYYGEKGFAQVRLRTPAGLLTLIDTHLHARYSSSVWHQFRPHRAGQVVELALAVRRSRDPVVVVGDFNFEEGQPEHTVLTGLTGLRDVAIELESRPQTVWGGNAYRKARHPGKRIDYVFARDGADSHLLASRIQRIFDEPIPGRDHHPTSYSDHAGVLAELELAPGGSEGPRAQPAAIELAREMLAVGRADARRRRSERRTWAGAGFGVAALAAAGVRTPPLTRRRLLRGGLQGVGLLALTPGVGFGLLSEVFVPDEIRAFESLSARLAALETRSGEHVA